MAGEEMTNNIKIFFKKTAKAKDFLHKAGLKPSYFIAAVALSFLVAIFEGISVGGLIPLVKGVISLDFNFVRRFFPFNWLIETFPIVFKHFNASIFIILLGVVFVSAVLKNIIQYISFLAVLSQVRKFSNGIRQLIFERYLNFGKLFFDRTNMGYLHTVLIEFTSQIAGQLSRAVTILQNFFELIVYLTIMFIISWKLTSAVLIIFPILNYSLKWLIKKIEATSELHAESYVALSSKISNILSCMPLVKLYAMEKKEKAHFASLSSMLEKVEFSMDKKNNLIAPIQETIMLVSVVLIISAMSFIIIKERSTRIAGFLVYFYILRRSQGAFGVINAFKGSLAMIKGTLADIGGIFDDQNKFFIPGGKIEFTGLKSDITINNLTFSYVKEVEILRDVNLSIEKKKMTAIVGPTGSGKTTLAHLILRFYDCPASSIFIDGIDIREFTLESLRSYMALVSQDTLLFNDTIKNNIIYGMDERTADEQVMDVIKKARLYDFIKSLPGGIDTYIGDRGIKLSGGEKQRVSIARALLKGAEILILDEATSSLDSRTERLIQEAINEAVKERTTIVIAHRLSTIKSADKIVVIENGRFIEQGSLEALLSKKGKFYEYWEEQKFF